MFRVGDRVRITIKAWDDETEGFIGLIDPEAFPEEETPYRVVTETRCLGYFGESELKHIKEKSWAIKSKKMILSQPPWPGPTI